MVLIKWYLYIYIFPRLLMFVMWLQTILNLLKATMVSESRRSKKSLIKIPFWHRVNPIFKVLWVLGKSFHHSSIKEYIKESPGRSNDARGGSTMSSSANEVSISKAARASEIHAYRTSGDSAQKEWWLVPDLSLPFRNILVIFWWYCDHIEGVLFEGTWSPLARPIRACLGCLSVRQRYPLASRFLLLHYIYSICICIFGSWMWNISTTRICSFPKLCTFWRLAMQFYVSWCGGWSLSAPTSLGSRSWTKFAKRNIVWNLCKNSC